MADISSARRLALGPITSSPSHCSAQAALEVHLLDYAGDLYDHELHIEFVDKIREDDRRFTNEADLVRQIQADVTAIRNRLA